MVYALACLAATFVVINILATILIVRELQKRHIKINFLLIKLYIFRYVNQYKAITTEEQGKPGLLYYLWIVSIILMALAAFGVILAQV